MSKCYIIRVTKAPDKLDYYAVDFEFQGGTYTMDIRKDATQLEVVSKIRTVVEKKALPSDWLEEFDV